MSGAVIFAPAPTAAVAERVRFATATPALMATSAVGLAGSASFTSGEFTEDSPIERTPLSSVLAMTLTDWAVMVGAFAAPCPRVALEL